jgi:hypothetical protein
LTLPGMLRELGVAEQRCQSVLAVLAEGRSVVEVAGQFGVSRQSVSPTLTCATTSVSSVPDTPLRSVSAAAQVDVLVAYRSPLRGDVGPGGLVAACWERDGRRGRALDTRGGSVVPCEVLMTDFRIYASSSGNAAAAASSGTSPL